MHSPVSVRTTPAFQSRPTPSFVDVKCNCAGSPHIPHGQLRMPCTPLRVCAPPHRFPIRANTLSAVKCNCAGSPHTPHGQPKDAVHSPVSVHTILWLPNPGNTIVNVLSATPKTTCTECWGDIQLLLLLSLMTVLRVYYVHE